MIKMCFNLTPKWSKSQIVPEKLCKLEVSKQSKEKELGTKCPFLMRHYSVLHQKRFKVSPQVENL